MEAGVTAELEKAYNCSVDISNPISPSQGLDSNFNIELNVWFIFLQFQVETFIVIWSPFSRLCMLLSITTTLRWVEEARQ